MMRMVVVMGMLVVRIAILINGDRKCGGDDKGHEEENIDENEND